MIITCNYDWHKQMATIASSKNKMAACKQHIFSPLPGSFYKLM